MSDVKVVYPANRPGQVKWLSVFVVLLSFAVPVQSVFATSGIARSVATFCAPSPTVPDVNSCSSCHSTTNNRGPNDLTTAGQWSVSQSTFGNFCPGAAPVPTPTPPATPAPGTGTPAPGTGTGMGTGTGSRGKGRGRGSRRSSSDDDDDDDRRKKDDDD